MSAQLLVDVVTGLAWTAAAYKLPAVLRHPRDPAKRSYWLALCLMALALTVLLPQCYVAIDRLTGRPNLARLLGDGLGLLAAWATQALLYHVNYPADVARRQVRRVGMAVIAALLLMACFFALAPLSEEAFDFTGRYQTAPFIPEYRIVFLAALGLAMANFARLSWRYARETKRPATSLGLRMVAVAGDVGLVYVANEVLRIGTAQLGVAEPIPNPGVVSQLLIATFMALGLVGTTMPAWGPYAGIPRLATWLDRYRSLRRLYPLWLALYRVHPQIALNPPRTRLMEVLDGRDLHHRLYRRVVEIRDGILYLRPSMRPDDAVLARQLCALARLPEAEAAVVVDAALLAAALRRLRFGATPIHTTPPLERHGGADLPSEIATLERLAHCYRHSPIVSAVVARVELHTTVSTPLEQVRQ